MSASPSALREEASERNGMYYDADNPNRLICEWVSEHATDEQLREIGEYALSSDELWSVFSEQIHDAMRWGYERFTNKEN